MQDVVIAADNVRRRVADACCDLLRLTNGCRLMQSRWMSLVESMTNVFVGYGVAVVTQILIFPAFGLYTTLEQNLQMGAVFTLVSIVRSYKTLVLCSA